MLHFLLLPLPDLPLLPCAPLPITTPCQKTDKRWRGGGGGVMFEGINTPEAPSPYPPPLRTNPVRSLSREGGWGGGVNYCGGK